MFDITLATCSEPGGRTANEDALRAGVVGATWIAILSDGAGGHARGAEASRRVVEHIDAAVRGGLIGSAPAFAPDPLARALLSAHQEIQDLQVGAEGRQRMHATVVVLWIDGATDTAVWSHVGDSRLYRIRRGVVEKLTVDDSVVQRMLDGGVLTQQQAKDHPMKNQLLAAIGMQDGIDPHTPLHPVPLEDGDAYLLCSDGWWGLLEDNDILDTLFEADTVKAWIDAMRNLVSARGLPGQDNFSAIAVWAFDPAETTQSMPEADTSADAGVDDGADGGPDGEATVFDPLWDR